MRAHQPRKSNDARPERMLLATRLPGITKFVDQRQLFESLAVSARVECEVEAQSLLVIYCNNRRAGSRQLGGADVCAAKPDQPGVTADALDTCANYAG